MLEHVGETGAAFGIVHRAGIDVGVEGNHGRFVAFEHDEVHAVGEGEFGDALREFLQILGGQDYVSAASTNGRRKLASFTWSFLLYILAGADWMLGISPLEKTKPFSGMRGLWGFCGTNPSVGGVWLFDETNPISVGAVVRPW